MDLPPSPRPPSSSSISDDNSMAKAMAPLTLDLSTTPYVPFSFRACKFLQLPPELRRLIYAYVLIEPDRLAKRHSPFCSHYPGRSSTAPEAPPFLTDRYYYSKCKCLRRQGMNLLLANRQIHAEASPVFWSKNSFDFAVESKVPAGTQSWHQHLQRASMSALALGCTGANLLIRYQSGVGRSLMTKQWDVFFKCPNLRTLELCPTFLYKMYNEYTQLPAHCPHLKHITLAYLMHVEVCKDEGLFIFVKVTDPLPLRLENEEAYHVAITSFITNLCIHARVALTEHVLLPPPDPTEPGIFGLPGHLTDQTTHISLSLRDGTRRRFPIYGLPNSPATRTRHAKQCIFDELQRRAAGLPSRKEEEAAQAKREEKQRDEVEKSKAKEQEVLRLRKRANEIMKARERATRDREEEEREAKQSANRKARLRRKVRKLERSKAEERKRVPPK
ncbi:hypothetical protein FQN50_001056 [Emmonsiellopsis sp. PD_5]|nr:hypothetical protein FQN50_001056 [Emmonsiellopsis sp. PD_5]